MESKTIFKYAALTLVAGCLVAVTGCSQADDGVSAAKDPFEVTWELGGEERSVTLAGDSLGHKAGETSSFELKLSNEADEAWQAECCVLLVNTEDVMFEIKHQSIDVPAGVSTQMTVPADFPEDLDGPYGLVVLIPGRGALASTINIGDREQVGAGPWAIPTVCPSEG